MRFNNTEQVVGREELAKDFDRVIGMVKKYGFVLLADNNALYKLSVINANDLIRTEKQKAKRMTLPEAMIRVLRYEPGMSLHSKEIADKITQQELFFKKDRSFVHSVQVRACASNNPHLFNCLKMSRVELRPDYNKPKEE